MSGKIILHAPVSDEALLAPFVDACLRDGVSIVAVVGDGCERLEDLIDDLIVGDGTVAGRFFCTTSHPGEGLDAVLEMLCAFGEDDGPGVIREVRL